MGCLIHIEGRTLTTNLIVFDMERFNIILEMDWLSNNHAIIDYHDKEIIFRLLTNSEFKFVGTKVGVTSHLISATHTNQLLLEGCQVYLACLKKSPHKERKMEEIPIVQEFLDVSSEDFLRLSLDSEIEFCIDLISRAAPISKAPYMMALAN